MLPAFICAQALAIDGDTIACANRPNHVRIARIDAPELPGHCRRGRHCARGDPYAAKDALATKLGRGVVNCQPVPASPRGGSSFDRWGRTVARCSVAGRDIGHAMLNGGFAIKWPHD